MSDLKAARGNSHGTRIGQNASSADVIGRRSTEGRMANEATGVEGFARAPWRKSPLNVVRSATSATKIGALIHSGYASGPVSEEVRAPKLATDCLILCERPADVRSQVGDDKFRLTVGGHCAAYFTSGQPSVWLMPRGCGGSVLQLHVPVTVREKILGEIGVPTCSLRLFSLSDPIVRLGVHLRDALLTTKTLSSLAIESYTALIVEGCAKGQPLDSGGSMARWKLNRVIELMHARLADDLTLQELAESVQLSLTHFTRSFRRATGVSAHRYLTRLRVAKAEELLRSTNLPILKISELVGFPDPSYFARVFRRQLGVTPGFYRRT